MFAMERIFAVGVLKAIWSMGESGAADDLPVRFTNQPNYFTKIR